jgi:hypothetical protein
MPDHDDDLLEDEEPRTPGLRKRMKALEDENKALKEQVAEGQQTNRRLAFIEAGVDLKDPKASYFLKAYDGEITPEAIRTAALEAGFIQATEAGPPPEEKDAWSRMGQTTNGAGAASDGPVDWDARINATTNEQELRAVIAEMEAARRG